MGLPATEQNLYEALTQVWDERAKARPQSKYWYPLSQVTYDVDEIAAVCDALLSTETTMGRRVAEFERRFAELHGGGHAVMVNSGSSADLLAALLLTNPEAPLLQPGDEVLAPAVTWPTQIDSLLMAGLSVRLVDVDPTTLAMDLDDLESKIGPRTRAVSAVHLMGNPLDMERLTDICRTRELQLLEDCCEALGARWNNDPVGTFGLAGTYSFFFSHHITTMEGGMVLVRDEEVADTLRLFRAHGWTRGVPKRDVQTSSEIDSRYKFVNWGLNVRPTEAQGAFGLVQLDRLARFDANRAHNAARFAEGIADLAPTITLMQVPAEATCSWFALPLMVAEDGPVNRDDLAARLEDRGVETRPVVAGNLARQPMMQLFPQVAAGALPNADRVHENGLYIGLHPTRDDAKLDRLIAEVRNALVR